MENKKLLVDVNTAINAIDEYMKNVYDCPLSEIVEYQRSCQDTKCIYIVQGLCEATEIIKDAPTVDAVEVVHGRWITDQVEAFNPLTEEPYLLDVLQCSVCGEYFDVSEARNYCPNCGAKMDGGNEDGQ